ncbi:phosphopantetheine-binding protein [Frankia sp. Cas3]|uniref:phosphopantetheine-binding protein n=1 Tax=Frankia sp. Cas3 TaxID=3073926 RepID=UPI002AD2194B|nr:phosphopantetheine-binding protein [Frankia sp. Cas3]
MLSDVRDTDLEGFLARLLAVEPSAVTASADLRNDLHLDSLQQLELLVWLAARGVDIDATPAGQIVTVADACMLLDTARGSAGDGHPVVGRRRDVPPGPVTRAGVRSPRLHNGRFALRPVTPEYLPFLYELAISEEIGFRWRFRGAVPNQETFQAGLWQGVLAQFVVVLPATGEPIGLVVAYNADTTRGIAYLAAVFTPDYLLTGLPASAVELFVRYLFQVWNLRKLYMEVPEFNYELIASGEGRRFDIEGRLRDFNYYDGRFWDEYLLALCRHHVGLPPVPSTSHPVPVPGAPSLSGIPDFPTGAGT